jgi:lysophospholipase L1-like esterase
MRLLIVVLICIAAFSARADDAKKKTRIVMVGDSTMASYEKPPADRPDLTGWGQVFGEFFSDRVEILNHASSGRSLKSFAAEGRWKKALDAKPDYVFIQFGHNDQKLKDEAGNPETGFRDLLRKYIDEAQKIGAKPILVTPVARRTFQDGKVTTTLMAFADATKAVAKEKEVPVIDLHKLSVDLFDKLGEAGSADFNPKADDRSHFSRKGAKAMAELRVSMHLS